MFGNMGMLELIWFLLALGFGLFIGFRLAGASSHDDTVLGMEQGTAQIMAHGAMFMALGLNSTAIKALFSTLLERLPQSGTAINEATALVIVGLLCLFWVALPALVAMARITYMPDDSEQKS